MDKCLLLLLIVLPFFASASFNDNFIVIDDKQKTGIEITNEYGIFAIDNSDNGHEHRPAKFKIISHKSQEVEFEVIETSHNINKNDITIILNGNWIGKGEAEVDNVKPNVEHSLGLQLFNIRNEDYPAGTILKVVVKAEID